MKKLWTVLPLALLLISIVLSITGGTAFAQPAQPTSVQIAQVPQQAQIHLTPDWCGSTQFFWNYLYHGQSIGASVWCTGGYSVNDQVTLIATHRWSGYFDISGPGYFYTQPFCDNNQYSYPASEGDILTYVYLSPVKESWCA